LPSSTGEIAVIGLKTSHRRFRGGGPGGENDEVAVKKRQVRHPSGKGKRGKKKKFEHDFAAVGEKKKKSLNAAQKKRKGPSSKRPVGGGREKKMFPL